MGAKQDSKNLYWTTDINTELPIHMERGNTPASIEPITYCQLFEKNAIEEPDRLSL